METERIYVPASLLEAILTIMHVRLSHPLPSQLQRTFERYFIAFGVKGICDAISSECSFCIALARFPKQLDDFNPSPGPLHPGTHMNIDILKRSGQVIVVNCDRFSNFVTSCIARSETREEMVESILTTVTPIRHGSKVQVRTDRATAFSSLAGRPDPQLEENGITLILGDEANPNKNAAVDKMMQELEGELRRLSPEGHRLSVGTLSQAVNNLNNRTRGHGLTASQVHFSRDSQAGTNLHIKDEKLWQIREERKEALRKASSRPPSDPVKPGQTVFLRDGGTKHKAREPFLVTKAGPEKVTMQKMVHINQPSGGPPRITSYTKQVNPRFLYIPPHRRYRRPPLPEPVDRGPALPQPHIRPPPRSDHDCGRLPAPPLADLEVEVIYIHRGEAAGDEAEEREEEIGHLRVRPMEELLIQGDHDPGGGDQEDEGEAVDEEGEAGDAVVQEHLPAATHGPRTRRRPPREQWLLARDLQPQQAAAPQAVLPQPPQAAAPQAVQVEPMADERHLTGSGRLTRPPDFFGMEKDRDDLDTTQAMNISTSSVERDDPHPGSPPAASSSSPTPPGTADVTPLSTPATSPDTSAVAIPQNLFWLLDPMPCSQGRTVAERANDVTERHRHWSFTGPGVVPNHPRFINWYRGWDPGRWRRTSSMKTRR